MTDDPKKEYDQRQYRLMSDRLKQYQVGKLDLPSLIADLEALLVALEETDEAWKDDFRSEWGTLEIAYATALDRVEQGLIQNAQMRLNQPSEQSRIADAVRNLRHLVQARIDTPEM